MAFIQSEDCVRRVFHFVSDAKHGNTTKPLRSRKRIARNELCVRSHLDHIKNSDGLSTSHTACLFPTPTREISSHCNNQAASSWCWREENTNSLDGRRNYVQRNCTTPETKDGFLSQSGWQLTRRRSPHPCPPHVRWAMLSEAPLRPRRPGRRGLEAPQWSALPSGNFRPGAAASPPANLPR